ncbi:hypothetical protein IMZ48_09670 [Candidatus Bathyarchaeota archaeon]|nr:hypothetical protein [Candidatus Bathyarchaeota archaeon]
MLTEFLARAIQDQLLKDFQNKSEFSNWFDREETASAAVATQPNPRNIEHEKKIQQLEEKIKRYGQQLLHSARNAKLLY